MRAAAQELAQVVNQRAHVHAFAAGDAHEKAVRAGRPQIFEGVHPGGSGFQFNGFPFTRQVIHALPVSLDGGVHRRYLQDVSGQPFHRRPDLVLACVNFRSRYNSAGGILGVGLDPQARLGDVRLLLVDQIVEEPCAPSDAKRQNARRVRVQRAAVADAGAPGQHLAHFDHRVGRSHARCLQQVDESVHLHPARFGALTFNSL